MSRAHLFPRRLEQQKNSLVLLFNLTIINNLGRYSFINVPDNYIGKLLLMSIEKEQFSLLLFKTKI